MSGVLKVVGAVAAIGFTALTLGAGAPLGLAAWTAGFAQTALAITATVASIGSSLLQKRPASVPVSTSAVERLTANIDPRTPRKSVFGVTALNADIRDQEFTDDQDYLHRFIVCAAHKIHGYDSIYFDDKLAWTSAGGVQGEFVGYLTVTTRTEGSAGNAINISARMGTTRRYTGCAYIYLRYKLTDEDSPFAQGIPSRMTIIGDGAYVYDPRLDSTVAGGSGSHRADDQATWEWDDDASRNPALGLLWYLLGWRINSELSVGLGLPPGRIDMESFITAANLCDESVTLSGGGTEPRYRCDGVWSEGDDPTLVLDQLKASMNADLDDVGGKLRLTVFSNDLASPVASFTDENMLGTIEWNQTPPLDQTFNVVRGLYTDPSTTSLYQTVDFPEVSLSSVDGIDRIDTFNLALVQSPSQAQRLAKQRLQRQQYGGELRTIFDLTGWKVLKNDVIELTAPVFGWVDKLFRVAEIEQGMNGLVPIVLREENAAIYAWDADESPAVVAAEPTLYDRALDPIIAAISIDIPALIANGARIGTSFPSATDSAENQLFIRSDLGNRVYIRNAGDGLLRDDAGSIEDDAGSIEVYEWVDITDQQVIDAATAASTAQATANSAITQLANIASDGILSRSEKPTAQRLYNRLAKDFAEQSAKAISLGEAASENAAAIAAMDALDSFLASILPAWSDATADSSIVRVTWDSLWAAAENAVSALLAAITAIPGADGYTRAVVNLHKRSATSPSGALPSGTFTYVHATGALSGGTLNGWTIAEPAADGNPLWIISAAAYSNTATDSIAAAEFSAPILKTGAGMTQTIVHLWRRGTTAPADPSGTFTYTIAGGALSGGTLNGWTQAVPATDGTPLWHKQAVASTYGATDSIAAAEFSAPIKVNEDGAPGPAQFTLAAQANVVVGVDTIEKTAGAYDWDAAGSSTEAYVGGCFMAAKVLATEQVAFGFCPNPAASASYTNLKLGLRTTAGGDVQSVKDGAVVGTVSTYVPGDAFSAVYDNASARFYKNGVLITTLTTDAGLALFLFASLTDVGYVLSSLKFGPAGAAGAAGENGASGLTSSIRPGNSINIPAYYGGAAKAALPVLTMAVYAGDATNRIVAASRSVTPTGLTGCVDNGDGTFTPGAMTTDPASVLIEAVYGGVTTTQEVIFNKKEDAQAYASAIDSTISGTSSASYSAENGGPLTIPVGPDGTITLAANIPYSVSSGSAKLVGKFRYRTTPGSGSWVDVATETADSGAALPAEPSTLSFSETLAGPSSAANWEFDLQLRNFTGTTVTTISSDARFTTSWSG